MTDDASMLIASVTVIKLLEGDDVSIHVTTEPDDLAVIDILGMLAFAQHATAIDNMPPYEPEDWPMTDKTITVTLKLDLDDLAAQFRAAADALTDQPDTEWNFNEVGLLTDRYAANEARQREEAAQPDPLEEPARPPEPVIDYEDIREGMTIEATYGNGTRFRFVATRGYACWTDPSGCFRIMPPGTDGLDPERVIRLIAPPAQTGVDAPEPDPLDEDDHRAPDTSPAPQDAAQGAAEGADDAVEGGGAAGPSEALAQQDLRPHMEQIAADARAFVKAFAALLCHECDHGISKHNIRGCTRCGCGLSWIAQATS